MLDISKNVVVCGPKAGKCVACESDLKSAFSIQAKLSVVFKTVSARLCIPCAKDSVAFFEARIAEAVRGEIKT